MATAVNLAKACDEERVRKPYSGNLYLRFDEGSGVTPAPTLPVGLLLLDQVTPIESEKMLQQDCLHSCLFVCIRG